MLRWKSKCAYHAGRYPVTALLDLMFILLLLFVLSSSMLYLPGVFVGTALGEQEDEDDPASFSRSEDFSQYVVADKMVLTIDDEGGMELNMRSVTLESLDNELEKEANKLLRMLGKTRNITRQSTLRKGFRPKLVISAAPNVSMEILDDVFRKVRDKKMDAVMKMRKTLAE